MPSLAVRLADFATALAVALAPSCARPPCDALECAPACPRDASRDASGHCACAPGTVLALGACVSPGTGDAYCGPGERMGADGCSARSCAGDEALDIATGTCAPRAPLHREQPSCPDTAVVADRGGTVVCVRAADTCPHGTVRDGERCARPPACPPGSLPEGSTCRSFVSRGASGRTVVDVGAWAAWTIGIDGGPGSADLCRTLSRRVDTFGVPTGETLRALVHVTLTVPDQDTTRAVRSVNLLVGTLDAGVRTMAPSAAADVADRAVAALVEPFRGLGGEASSAAIDVTVRCDVTAP